MQNLDTQSKATRPSTIWELLYEPFHHDDLEWRIAQASKSRDGQIRATCFAYVSARAIQDRLDSVVGPENWVASYYFVPGGTDIKGGVMCKLSIRVGNEWICKEDGADQTDREQFKGGLSSAFKRAAVLFGMGRYLYRLDTGWVVIVDAQTRGRRFDKTKEGDSFFWLPPELPEWALPKEREDEKPSAGVALPSNQRVHK